MTTRTRRWLIRAAVAGAVLAAAIAWNYSRLVNLTVPAAHRSGAIAFANDRVEDNVSPVARMYYAASAALCCPHAIADGGRLVLGAQAGEARLGDVFRKAGLPRVRRAAETPFNLILEVRR